MGGQSLQSIVIVDAKTIIANKRDGKELDAAAIEAFVKGTVSGEWSPAQIGAMLMAIWLRGLTPGETVALTGCMRSSGDCMNFPRGLPVVDKHSTGGVGDKVSLVLAPLAAACGLRVPMLSGRGLGHTGGTLDKLESIPGFRTRMTKQEIEAQVGRIGFVMAGQSESIVPADRILYATRDESSTVESKQLITASILSKKLAEGLDALVLDVKYGRGAFMATLEEATELARMMVDIGHSAGCRVGAWLTRMDAPLGAAVGNAVEVAESVELLRGQGPKVLRELVIELTAGMIRLGRDGAIGTEEARELAIAKLDDGSALELFRKMVEAQGGDPRVVDDLSILPQAPLKVEITFDGTEPAWVADIDARGVAERVLELDAGRRKASDDIDPATGISGLVQLGQKVGPGDVLAVVHCRTEAEAETAGRGLREAIQFSKEPVEVAPLVTRVIL